MKQLSKVNVVGGMQPNLVTAIALACFSLAIESLVNSSVCICAPSQENILQLLNWSGLKYNKLTLLNVVIIRSQICCNMLVIRRESSYLPSR